MTEKAEQRRMAAILVADMVGYSRLMEADERDTLARLKAQRSELLDPKIIQPMIMCFAPVHNLV